MSKKISYLSGTLGLIGFILTALGITLLIFQSCIVNYVLQKILIVAPDSVIFDYWRKTPVEIPTTFYYFNWTNKEDFYNLSVKPKFEEVGPYKLRQTIEKVNITWNNNNTVTFKQVRTYNKLDEDTENENFKDQITTINYIFMCAAHYARNWSGFTKIWAFSLFESLDNNYYMTETAGEQTIDGFESPVLSLGQYFPYLAPEIPRFDSFSWINIINTDSAFEGIFTTFTGKNLNFDLQSWNYNSKSSYFNDSCNDIQGTLGDFNSFKENKEYVDIFLPEMCRYIRLDFEKEEEVDGILGYKYSIQDSTLDNGTKIPGNACFCNGDCIPSGMLNISSCRYDLNTYISLPNFYAADSVYVNGVEGLHPEKSKHESYVILEPVTMLPIKFKARNQFNIHVHPVDNVRVFENAPSVYFPVLWVEQKLKLPNHITWYLKMFLKLPMFITILASIVIFIGAALISFVVYNVFIKWMRKNDKVKSDFVLPEKVPLKYEDVL